MPADLVPVSSTPGNSNLGGTWSNPEFDLFLSDEALEEMLKENPDIQEAINAVSDQIAQAARNGVPIDTGALHDSIRAIQGDGRTAGGAVVVADGRDERGNISHAAYVEFGTLEFPPRPFMRNAAVMVAGATGSEYEPEDHGVVQKGLYDGGGGAGIKFQKQLGTGD